MALFSLLSQTKIKCTERCLIITNISRHNQSLQYLYTWFTSFIFTMLYNYIKIKDWIVKKSSPPYFRGFVLLSELHKIPHTTPMVKSFRRAFQVDLKREEIFKWFEWERCYRTNLLSSFQEVVDACLVVRREEHLGPSFLVAFPSYREVDRPSYRVEEPCPLEAYQGEHP